MKKTKKDISYNMSQIRSSGTKIERILSSWLARSSITGYKKNSSLVYGKPDFSWSKNKVAVFCDSSFWHGYRGMTTKRHSFKTNKKFWTNKIKSNIERDKKVTYNLRKSGWIVVRFWDFQIKGNIDKCIDKIHQALRKRKQA